jgi:hypothetical protein
VINNHIIGKVNSFTCLENTITEQAAERFKKKIFLDVTRCAAKQEDNGIIRPEIRGGKNFISGL